ncbi:serine/threonine-protein kinase [Thermoactinospora rubra]|uniref:serine/threonine-protein kinase n=1 Tax=Thermoactinospora rubra TaxID=1088767 RepID=UPI000A1185D9|nr:serine/threonine-protein kinase [Thermoactinospora rubra]
MRQIGGRYLLHEVAGRGGMGIVWRAFDQLLHREVALKELTLSGEVSSVRRRVLREARMAAGLSHPNIVTVHDLIEEGGRLWIVMEYLEGLSLHELLSQVGTLPAQSVAAIGRHLLAALRHAHDSSVLHRDVKPANVMLTGDRVVLTDFGIATADTGARGGTSRGLRGTPAFMAPERLHGGAATKEADMWSFGATLYSAVEGQPPYPGKDAPTVVAMVHNGGYPPPRRAGALRPVIEGLLRHDPARRLTPDQAAALLADLRSSRYQAAI